MSDPPNTAEERRRPAAAPRLVLLWLILAAFTGFALGTQADFATAPAAEADRAIRLSRSAQAQLSAEFAEVAGRPPTAQERAGLAERWVREEVLSREALRRRLGEDDPLVRRRLAVRMEQVIAAEAAPAEPDQATLEQWLRDHPDRFAQGARVTFDQVLLADRSRAVVARALLEGGANWTRLGDAANLPPHFEAASLPAVARELGPDFAHSVAGIQPGRQWHGPIESGLGWHLVRVTARDPGTPQPLAAVRKLVADDWRAATARRRAEAEYRRLRQGYTIAVDR